jgi:ABC-2 type transport system permease protein
MAAVRASELRLLAGWTVARLRTIRRIPRASFFTFVFPLILFVLIGGTNTGTVPLPNGGEIDATQYLAPSIAIFGTLAACYTTIIFSLANAKEQGILKRVRGTPLPPWIYVGAVICAAIITAFVSVALMFFVAIAAFDFKIYDAEAIPAAALTLVLGGATLAALGVFVSTFVQRADSAPAIANITMFPLMFLSGIFFSTADFPNWLQNVVDVFPVSHLVDAFGACFRPFTHGASFSGKDLGVMAIWLVAAGFLATRRFRFEQEED